MLDPKPGRAFRGYDHTNTSSPLSTGTGSVNNAQTTQDQISTTQSNKRQPRFPATPVASNVVVKSSSEQATITQSANFGSASLRNLNLNARLSSPKDHMRPRRASTSSNDEYCEENEANGFESRMRWLVYRKEVQVYLKSGIEQPKTRPPLLYWSTALSPLKTISQVARYLQQRTQQHDNHKLQAEYDVKAITSRRFKIVVLRASAPSCLLG
jgi:hypothetical protein